MSKRWTLYWVSSDGYEDCFVVARNRRSAARVEIDMNGFDPGDVEAERIGIVPHEVERDYFCVSEDVRPWPWYVYGKELFAGMGAEFRETDGTLQMLLDEIVYEVADFEPCSIRRAYAIGKRAIDAFDAVPEFDESYLNHRDPDYLGSITPFVHQLIGRCLVRCQQIENNLSNSFIFCAPQKDKPEGKTINDLRAEWRKLTFGQLLKVLKKDWDMLPELEAGLELFRNSRNLFTHRLTTDPRYDISTRWGVMELLPFLQFFDLQTKIVARASEASLAASIAMAIHQWGAPEGLELTELGEDHDERVGAFFEMFWMKGSPWPSREGADPDDAASSPDERSTPG
jgi:hypothetical protein